MLLPWLAVANVCWVCEPVDDVASFYGNVTCILSHGLNCTELPLDGMFQHTGCVEHHS